MLQYTCDTLFICEDKLQNILTLKVVLRCFEVTFDLKVNFY